MAPLSLLHMVKLHPQPLVGVNVRVRVAVKVNVRAALLSTNRPVQPRMKLLPRKTMPKRRVKQGSQEEGESSISKAEEGSAKT